MSGATRGEFIRVIGNCFFEAHPFREGAAGLVELSQARPLLERLSDNDLARLRGRLPGWGPRQAPPASEALRP